MKHLRRIGSSVIAALFTVAGSASAQTPTAGPPPPPAAAMPPKPAPGPAAPAAKPAPTPAPAAAKPAAAPVAAAKPAAAAPPPAAAAPAAPKPAAELDQLKMFEATWRCEGKQPASPLGPEQTYKSVFKGKKDVDNFWLALQYTQKKTKAHPLAISTKGFVGYDAMAKKYVTTGVDNMGGWANETSAGWEGDKMTFVGDAQIGGQKLPFRETYTKKGDNAMTWTGELKMGKDWISVGTDECKK